MVKINQNRKLSSVPKIITVPQNKMHFIWNMAKLIHGWTRGS